MRNNSPGTKGKSKSPSSSAKEAKEGWGNRTRKARYWIEKLGLEPHPEGGYFRQTYKAELRVVSVDRENPQPVQSHPPAENAGRVGQPDRERNPHPKIAKGAILEWGTQEFGGTRTASTAIYFLLEGENFSAFHRLRSDEMWHFYAGSALVVHVIDAAGEYSSIRLGNCSTRGEVFQAVVKAGCWFASEISRDSHVSQRRRDTGHPTYALVGCTVAPGFEFEDFELARPEELVGKFPEHRELIERLTRK